MCVLVVAIVLVIAYGRSSIVPNNAGSPPAAPSRPGPSTSTSTEAESAPPSSAGNTAQTATPSSSGANGPLGSEARSSAKDLGEPARQTPPRPQGSEQGQPRQQAPPQQPQPSEQAQVEPLQRQPSEQAQVEPRQPQPPSQQPQEQPLPQQQGQIRQQPPVAQRQPQPPQNTEQTFSGNQRISPIQLTAMQVRQIQQALNSKAFNAGTVDGKWGPRTAAALRDFQQSQNIASNGQLDAMTWSALGLNIANFGVARALAE
jgi:Putative peptidoglycan binding domain